MGCHGVSGVEWRDPVPKSELPTCQVGVSDDGRRYTVTSTRVDENTGEVCDRCGAELWTRDGAGRFTLAFMLGGSPVLAPHYPFINCVVPE